MEGNGATSGASPETRRVIHELRQPLAALQMWVDLLAESLQGQLDDQQERYLAKVRAEVLRIGGVLAASASNPAGVSASGAAMAPGEQEAASPGTEPPAQPNAASERSAVQPDAVAGALEGLSLLVVEDDEMTAEALQLALESEGACVAVASTIADGLVRFREAAPDAVLSDLRVSDGDGFTLVTEIRKIDREAGRTTVAVAVTGYDSRETRAAARAAGFDETVTKPFAIDQLVATVARLVTTR
jgi:CheY-like chemotaxis protein